MGWFYRLLNYHKVKRYEHIVLLGYNCELAFQLFKHNHFLESSILAWSYIPSFQILLKVVNDISLIGSRGFEALADGVMHKDKATGISFHGKARPKDIIGNTKAIEDDVKELESRLAFLGERFKQIAVSTSSKLYVTKIRSGEERIKEKVQELQKVLSIIDRGRYDLLVIVENKEYAQQHFVDDKHLFFRKVDFFSPDDAVTSKCKNFASWQRIFDEFRPLNKLKQTKHYKFEDIS